MNTFVNHIAHRILKGEGLFNFSVAFVAATRRVGVAVENVRGNRIRYGVRTR